MDDLNSFMKGFFGFNRMNPYRFDSSFYDNFNHKKGKDEEDSDFQGNDSFHDDNISDVFKHMEDMFSNMFTFHNDLSDFGNFAAMEQPKSPRDLMLRPPGQRGCKKGLCPGEGFADSDFENFAAIEQPKSPRDLMLRPPGQRGCKKGLCPTEEFADSDLDDKVSKGGISILGERGVQPDIKPKTFAYQKSVKSKIIRSPDGVVEEHKTITDHSGKTVTTVRKSIGDQTYQVTTESDKNGIIEKKENFINIDESDIPSFEEKFSKPRNILPNLIEPKSDPERILSLNTPGDPKYWSIFKRFFG